MNRRQFVKTLGMGAVALGIGGTALPFADDKPQVAITIDDFNFFGASRSVVEQRNQALLDALRVHSDLKAAVFACGKYVNHEMGLRIVREWGRAGHIIANHTYSHWCYPKRGFEEYSQDIVRAEKLIADMPGFKKLFRFPMLKEGDSPEQRDKMRAFLKEHGYRMGYVTVDASDWYVDQRLRARLVNAPKADLAAYRKFYLDHLRDRATFYDGLSRKVLGRSVKHTLLVHHNLLNGLFLGDVLDMFQSRGWKLVDAEYAFTDPVFLATPQIVPAGESIIWALAKESGKFDHILRYPGEDGDYEKPGMDELGL